MDVRYERERIEDNTWKWAFGCRPYRLFSLVFKDRPAGAEHFDAGGIRKMG